MQSSESPPRTAGPLRRARLWGAALLVVNLLFLLLAARVPRIPLTEWRKGPVIHAHSVYGPLLAPRLFWLCSALFVDVYALLLFGWHAVGRRAGMGRAGRMMGSLAALAAALAVTEAALRRIVPRVDGDQFRPHPDVFYWNRAGLRGSPALGAGFPESTNSRGFRGAQDVPRVKAPDEYRVFVVGDSSAFGHMVRDHETFAEQLEQILRRRLDRPVRVINAACPGHCTYEGLIVFRAMGLPLEPDLLVVSYNNDPAPEYVEEKARASSHPLAVALRRVLYRSDYYLLFQRTVLNAWLRLRHAARRGVEPPLVPRVSLPDYTRNLQAFVALAHAHGCEVVFQQMPVNYEVLQADPDRRRFRDPAYPAALAALCEREGYALVDIDGDFIANRRANVFLEGHHFHPNPWGHLLVAELTARRVLEMLRGKGELHAESAPLAVPGAVPRRTVRIGYSTQTPLHCALGETLARTDILAAHAFDGVFHRFERGRDQADACRRGWIDATFSCEVPAMIHLGQFPSLAIAGSPGELGDVALVAREDARVHGVRDLPGRLVSVAGGASSELLFGQWLGEAGLTAGEQARIRVGGGPAEDAVQAIRRGEADAAALWDPWLSDVLLAGRVYVVRAEPFWSLVFLDDAFLGGAPENGPRYLSALREALAWIGGHKVEVIGWVKAESGLREDVILSVLEKNRFLRGEAPPDLGIGDRLRARLAACERYAREAGDVPAGFDLGARIRIPEVLADSDGR